MNPTLYFSKVQPNPQHPEAKRIAYDLYREHQLLWNLFDNHPNQQRDFLYHKAPEAYYLLSARQPMANVSPVWHIQTKPYAPQLQTGQTLRFQLRANPVITTPHPNAAKAEAGKTVRHDVVMHHKKATYPDKAKRPPMAQIEQEAGANWLTHRANKHGFQVHPENLLTTNYQQHRLKKTIRFSTLDFQGVLTITDPESFLTALNQGIGPAKAFGCGLLMLKPA